MDAQTINTVIAAAAEVLRAETGGDVDRGNVFLSPDNATAQEITSMVSFTGDILGAVSIGMSLAEAGALAGHMMGDPAVASDQNLVESAVAEISNMVGGRVHVLFSEQGISVDLSTPVVIVGKGTVIKTMRTPKVAIPLQLELGATVELQVALRKNAQSGALRNSA